ncbi:MAG: DUF4290 domain-containing protein [Bacteroidota bacterium]|jgi:hypothetical protein|nr:DUF4290 domain-containing protein [Bacteroidota bacterium]
MEYNTSKSDLILKEYGRNIQKLAEYVVKIEDRDQRTRYAHTLIELMRQINPVTKETPAEYSQKLWDDLYLMGNFNLEVDSPFPMPEKELLGKKPKRMDYNNNQVSFKHYGRNVELLIQKAIELEDPDEKANAVKFIGRLMKSFYAVWNKEVIDEEVIVEHIRLLSKNQLDINVEEVKANSLFESNTKGDTRESRDMRDKERERERPRGGLKKRPGTGKNIQSNQNKRRKN